MEFTIKKEIFFTALQKVENVIEKKNTINILSNILLDVEKNLLSLTATDLDVGIKILLPAEGDVEGKVALSAKNLVEIVKELPNYPVTLKRKDNNWVEISCHKSKFNIVGLGAATNTLLEAFNIGLKVYNKKC